MIDLTEYLDQEVSKVQSGGSWVDIKQDIFLPICIIFHSIALIISFWLLRETGCTTSSIHLTQCSLILYFALVAYVFSSIGYLTVLA